MNDKLRRNSLDVLRFPLAVVVVIVHVFSSNHINGYQFADSPFFESTNTFVLAFLKGVSVPIYFFISGYVFFITKSGHFDLSTYRNKIKNRIKTLLIPYIIWNGIAVFLELIKFLPPFANLLGNTVENNITIKNVLSAFWMYGGNLTQSTPDISVYPINHALWFIRDLMIVTVCSPLVHLLLRKTKIIFLLILGGLYIYAPYSTFAHLPQLSTAFLFFSLGAYLSIFNFDLVAICKKFVYPTSIIYFINSTLFLFISSTHHNEANVLKTINTFICIPMAFGITSLLLEKQKIKCNTFLSSASFFIYISHCLIVRKIKILLFMLINPSTQYSIILIYILTIILTIGLLLAAFALMRKYTPRLLKFIAGRK